MTVSRCSSHVADLQQLPHVQRGRGLDTSGGTSFLAVRDKAQRHASTQRARRPRLFVGRKKRQPTRQLGIELTDGDRRHALLKILPASVSLEMKTKANAEETAEGLKEWIRAQAEFIRRG